MIEGTGSFYQFQRNHQEVILPLALVNPIGEVAAKSHRSIKLSNLLLRLKLDLFNIIKKKSALNLQPIPGEQ